MLGAGWCFAATNEGGLNGTSAIENRLAANGALPAGGAGRAECGDQSLVGFYLTNRLSLMMPVLYDVGDSCAFLYRGVALYRGRIDRAKAAANYVGGEADTESEKTVAIVDWAVRERLSSRLATTAPVVDTSTKYSKGAELLSLVVCWQISKAAPELFDVLPVAERCVVWTDSHREELLADSDIPASVVTVTKLMAGPDVAVPNNFMYVRFSKSFLETYFRRQVDRTAAVHQTVLGAAVRGTSHTLGRTVLELVNNPTQAEAKLILKGMTTFNTVSYSGPVEIFGQGKTDFTASKKIWFDGLNVQQAPAKATATTHTVTTGIDTYMRLFRRIALRIAGRREAENHAEAERITAERTKQRVEKEFDTTGAERAETFSQVLAAQYAKLPLEGHFAITDIRCSTTPNMLEVEVLGRSGAEPRLVDAPAVRASSPDIELEIHTAMLRKAMLDPEIRGAFQAALSTLIEPPQRSAMPVALAKIRETEGGPKIHWTDADNSEWLRISWDAKEDGE
jgi:hypothetical protein